MEININAKYSRYADILPFVTDESRKELIAKVIEKRNPYTLTLADFFACVKGDFSCVVTDVDQPTTADVLWVENFVTFIEEFAAVLKRLSIPQTAEQKQAQKNCLPVDWQEGMLVFARKYFGLHNFADAEKITIGDFLIAKKDDYNTAIFERNLHKIQTQKLKQK